MYEHYSKDVGTEFINGTEGMNIVFYIASPRLRLQLQTIIHALNTINELLEIKALFPIIITPSGNRFTSPSSIRNWPSAHLINTILDCNIPHNRQVPDALWSMGYKQLSCPQYH